MDRKKIWKKTGFGILFVAACFVSMYILMKANENVIMVAVAAVLLLITAFLFLNEIFSDKAKKWAPLAEDEEDAKEVLSSSTDGEFRLKITKHMKEMEGSQRELIDVLKQQNTLFQNQIENLEHEIYMLSEKQVNQSKSIIKFNKENARQLAISERETLEYIMMELKRAIEDNAGAVSVKAAANEMPAMEEDFFTEPEATPAIALEEVSEAELFEVSDLPADEEFVIPDFPAAEEIPETVEEPAPEEAPLPVEEPAATDPFAGLGGDPNAMMTADDIAKLFEMQSATEPAPEADPAVEEEPEEFDLSSLFEDIAEGAVAEEQQESVAADPAPAEEEPVAEAAAAADPLAGLGGDPNAMMTPEDIAKLLASMGQ
ncbi:MAG: hypothetical protein J6K15_12655 [Lachnospiraceae bacterium]|nr:hypothetical protein [Lachnospiraceae bacterium]